MVRPVEPCPPAGDFIPARLGALSRPVLCVIIDTEEEFDWGAPFSRANRRVEALDWLHVGHRIFRRHGVKPAYLLDHPVASDPRSSEILGPWLAGDECVVGAQLHPWVTPPFEEVVCPANSFACNLPANLERRKLERLTQAVAGAVGARPVIYKAGRYGLDLRRERTLTDLGYAIDTSVVPNRSFAGVGGGPDYFGFPEVPFHYRPEGNLLYLPATSSMIGPLGQMLGRRHGRALFGRGMRRMHVPGALARSRLLERIMLTPEGNTLAEMCRLVDALRRNGRMVFTLSLHSPSFMPGGTSYAATPEAADALLGRVDGFLEHFLGRIGGVAMTPVELLGRIRDGAMMPPAPPGPWSTPSMMPPDTGLGAPGGLMR